MATRSNAGIANKLWRGTVDVLPRAHKAAGTDGDAWLATQRARHEEWRRHVASRMRAHSASAGTPAAKAAPPEPDVLELLRRREQRYEVLSSLTLADGPRRAAKQALEAGSRALGLAPPRLWWFDEPGGAVWLKAAAGWGAVGSTIGPIGCDGFFTPSQPGSIYVRVTDSAREAAGRVLHELKHYHQHRVLGTVPPVSDPRREELEADAAEFAEHLMAQLDDTEEAR